MTTIITPPTPTIIKNTSFQVEGSGYPPNTSVTLHIYYDPTLEGEIPAADDTVVGTTDANGDVTWDVDYPEDPDPDVIGFTTDPDGGWTTFVIRHVTTG